MNLLDFKYLQNNLNTQKLYGSDACIANLFLLQEKYNTWLQIQDNILYRYYYGSESRTGYAFPIPLNNCKNAENPASTEWLKTALDFIISDSKKQNRKLSFCLITREQKIQIEECLEKHFNKSVSWKTTRDDCDYIYLQENLADLPGSNYQKKRNHVSRFNRTYGPNWEYKSFPENDLTADMLFVEQEWFKEKSGDENPVLQLEQKSIARALENAELLRLKGGVLYINGIPAAMTLASPLSDSVMDVIYEKSYGDFERNGAYAVINQQFAKTCKGFLYLNREEDMGVEMLRKAKLSYKPTIILERFYGDVE